MHLDFSRCRDVWVPDEERDSGGFWSPPPEHVKVGVRRIVANPYFLLADDMGGMKTAQAIIAAQFLHDAMVIDRVIVVAPAAVRPKVWFDEDLGQLREQVFKDKRNIVSEFHQRIRAWSSGPRDARELRWIVTNYEFIRSEANLQVLLPYCGPRTMLILDESSAVRSWDSEQTQACMRLRWLTNRNRRPVLGAPRCGRILELNGTPVAESPMDIFSQANLLHPSILDCKYVTHFRARYAVQAPVLGGGGHALMSPYMRRVKQPDGTFKRVPQPIMQTIGWSEEGIRDIQQRLAPYILRREAREFGVDFALPPVALTAVLTKETWKHYCTMRDEMVVWLKTGVATARQAGVKSLRLSQITSGFVGGIEELGIDDDLLADAAGDDVIIDGERWVTRRVEPVQEVGREKLDLALEWHAEMLRRHPDLKLLTWCRFVPELRRYLAEVRERFGHEVGAACGTAVLGLTKREEREAALRMLHPKTAPVGAVTVGATQGTGAMGLNFTACRTVLDMSYDFSPWKKKQGDARVNRTGQTGPVSFFYIVAVGPKGQKTIDHHVLMHRTGKANLNDWTTAAWVEKLMEE